ncbi:hypothetical protein EON65_12185 [archaeon]|nr:MAG: hypothetical protein EON65_12185 [archaeon]
MESRPLVILEPPEPGFDWGERTDLNFQFDGPITRAKFREFLRNFRIANKYIYREALIRNWTRNIFSVEVDCAHLVEFDETLLHHLQVFGAYHAIISFLCSLFHCCKCVLHVYLLGSSFRSTSVL